MNLEDEPPESALGPVRLRLERDHRPADPLRGVMFDDLLALVAQRFDSGHAAVCVTAPDGRFLEAVVDGRGRPLAPAALALASDVATRRTTVVIRHRSHPVDRRSADVGPGGTGGGVQFFVGVPLTTGDGTVVGSLCAWDDEPHDPSTDDIGAIEQFGRHAATMIELQRVAVELAREREVLTTTGHLLEMIVAGAELPMVLHSLALAAEAAIAGTICSIHLLDGVVLWQGASPHLPADTFAAMDGVQIGPMVGSCGTAAHTGETVIVPDIATDPRWQEYRSVTLPHGLRACWSVPITGSDGQVLGTFALYYREIRVPRPDELDRLGRWVNLAEVAITRARDIIALREAASVDSLTGLVNRTEVMSRIAAARAAGGPVALLFVDLDQFKFVNDTLGHAAGDQVLQVAARRLADCAGPGHTVARFGGDEFVVLCPGCAGEAEADALARRMMDALHRPMSIDGRTLSLSASVGIALQRSGDSRFSDLISDADLAMYAAKRTGRNSFAMFTPGLRIEAADRLSMEADITLALTNGELDCAYQPAVDLQTGRLQDVEVLLRWTSPTRGSVDAMEFISVAEDSGLVGAVGRFVLERSCAQMAAWRAAAKDWGDVVLWVNVSPRQLVDAGFARSVAAILAENDVPAGNLGLEVTERMFIGDPLAVRTTLLQLRASGVHVAIDDFGTGYSSLAQLEHLPVDVLKIDRRFTSQITSSAAGTGVVAAIVTLADTMGLRVIAEGVETVAQRQALLRAGCQSGQGFLWSHPLRAGDFGLSRWQFADGSARDRTEVIAPLGVPITAPGVHG